MVVLVGPVELLVRHSDAVVRGFRVNDVQVARRLFPVVEASIQTTMTYARKSNARC